MRVHHGGGDQTGKGGRDVAVHGHVVGELHILGGQRSAVVEFGPRIEVEDQVGIILVLPAGGQLGDEGSFVGETHQRLVGRLQDDVVDLVLLLLQVLQFLLILAGKALQSAVRNLYLLEPMIRSDLWAGMPDWSAAGAAVAAGCSFEPVANRAELASSSAIAIVKAFFM